MRPPPSDPLEADLFRSVSDFNLNHIVRFHNTLQTLLEDTLTGWARSTRRSRAARLNCTTR